MARRIKASYIDIDGSASGQVLASNGTVVYWANVASNTSVNTDAQYVWTNTHTFNLTINGTANNALNANNSAFLGGNSATDLRTYADNKAANAYSNAISYSGNAAAAYANAIAYSGNAAQAYANAIAYSGNAAAAYANAVVFASNASNINTGTLAEARLPYRMDQNVRTTDNPTFANLTLTGSLSISGNVNVVGANTLSIVDNFIYLNSNNTVDNEDVGIVANYNDGTYRHAGIFRDASDGYWKVFDSYLPEPDANVNIDTTNTSFQLANFQAKSLALGNTSINWFVANSTATTLSGNVTISGAVIANGGAGTTGQVLTTNGTAVYWAGASGGFTNGQSISVNNFVITGAVTANSSNGTTGQVLTTNGSAVYWATTSTANGSAYINDLYDTFTANGTQNTFTLSQTSTTNTSIVTINGVIQQPVYVYSISNNTLTFTANPAANDVIDVRYFKVSGVTSNGEVSLAQGYINSGSINTTSTSATLCDSFNATTYRSAKYLVQITDNTNNSYHVSELLVIHNSGNSYLTESGIAFTNTSLGTFSTNVDSGSIRVYVTPTSANSTVKTVRTSIGV